MKCPNCKEIMALVDEFHIACAIAIRTYWCKKCKKEHEEIIKPKI